MIGLFRLLGNLSLRLNHAAGAVAGWLAWAASARHRRLTRENIALYANHSHRAAWGPLLRASIAEQGKGITELAVAWTAPVDKLDALVGACTGWQHVEAAKARQQAIIFVTPHLGCYDIAGRYLASRIPFTALYRPPKQTWLEPLMQEGRARGGASTAAADIRGVRTLLKTLKSGGNIMILPDQVPAPGQGGDGVWADFLGRPAYTMTLLPRLAQSTEAAVLFFFAERLPQGAGYHVHFEPMTEAFSDDKQVAARQTNAMVERLIAMAPAQYLWGYNRYKRPAGAPPSPPSPTG
jgi:KDO2-lipid IV(A) lauroyltransferase